ncbi:MAG: type II toxin-antitoxin system VapC family toxin [Terracidiphilus sp.]|jgi:predicted nucleic acid-binding protein
MIVLDTNVISEIMRPRPDPAVLLWLDRQPAISIWTTSVSTFEIRFGLRSMAEGRKRSTLIAFFDRWLAEVVQQRIASFDHAAAKIAADLAAVRRASGHPGDARDTMIAGIVLASRATLATRNFKHFEDIAGSVVNPWEA